MEGKQLYKYPVLLLRVVEEKKKKKIQYFWPLAIKIFYKRGDKRAKNKKSTEPLTFDDSSQPRYSHTEAQRQRITGNLTTF